MAGAVAAGHVIECGAQATGGNFTFAAEIGATGHIGLPVAEIAADGSAVITKAAGTGGAVTLETVTAQLLYEVDGPRYLTPDVVVRLDTVAVTADGPDRVRDVRHPRRAPAEHGQGGRGPARRAGTTRSPSCSPASTSRRRRSRPSPRCGPASPAGATPTTASRPVCCAPTAPTRPA